MPNFFFNISDQKIFSKISGDYNPIHVDPNFSRRSIFGSVVVHGINLVLFALNEWAKKVENKYYIESFKCYFRKHVNVDEEISLDIIYISDKEIKLELNNKYSFVVTRIIFKIKKSQEVELDRNVKVENPKNKLPIDLSIKEIEEAKGSLELFYNESEIGSIYPNINRVLDKNFLAVLLCSTRLVGTYCPGLNSIYSEIVISKRSHSNKDIPKFNYKTKSVDKRFALVALNFDTQNYIGTIKAFVRPKPKEQMSYLEHKNLVEDDEFINQKILIIGASRGLGEVSAKILAAGGSQVFLTYSSGEIEAKNIVNDINKNNGIAECFKLNIFDNKNIRKTFDKIKPSHILYFPTPFIKTGTKDNFSEDLYKTFYKYYVEAFQNFIMDIQTTRNVKIFYPSTIYIDKPPENLSEYVKAKIQGEEACNQIEKENHLIKIYKPRLEKMSTDQTTSISFSYENNPSPIMLEHLREFFI